MSGSFWRGMISAFFVDVEFGAIPAGLLAERLQKAPSFRRRPWTVVIAQNTFHVIKDGCIHGDIFLFRCRIDEPQLASLLQFPPLIFSQ